MDDLLCYNSSLEQHLRDVREVMAILRQKRLFVKASKCAFGREELGFLGHRISGAGVSVDLSKAAAVQPEDWRPMSSCANSLGYATTIMIATSSMDTLKLLPRSPGCVVRTESHAPWHWRPVEQHSFDALKRCLNTAPFLRTFNADSADDGFQRDCNLCRPHATLRLGTRISDDDDHYPVAYERRKLTAAEQAFRPRTSARLAVVPRHTLREFRHNRLGSSAPRPPGVLSDFTLRTDNQAV